MESDGRVYKGRHAGAAENEKDRNWRRLRRKGGNVGNMCWELVTCLSLSVSFPTAEAADAPDESREYRSRLEIHSAES